MQLFVPYYVAANTPVHRTPTWIRMLFALGVFVVCWIGSDTESVGVGYIMLLAAFVTSFIALAMATNLRACRRLMVIPAYLALWWSMFFIIGASVDAVRNVGSIVGESTYRATLLFMGREVLSDFRKIVALFAATSSAWLIVATVSSHELSTMRLLPASMPLNYALFSSLFSRFSGMVTRLGHSYRQAVPYARRRDVFRISKKNPLVTVWRGFVVFVTVVARHIPQLWNLRAAKQRLLRRRRE